MSLFAENEIAQIQAFSNEPAAHLLTFSLAVAGFIFIYISFTLLAFRWKSSLEGTNKTQELLSNYKSQLKREFRLSMISILIFGGYAVLIHKLYLLNVVEIRWDFALSSWVLEVFGLYLWNELHFFVSHRLLHTPFLMKKVHFSHHQSRIPTPFSSFSFHWFEGVLLGSVMVTIMFTHSFSIFSLLCLPILSLVINVMAHSGITLKRNITGFGFIKRHTLHHEVVNRQFGFSLPVFDWLISSFDSKNMANHSWNDS